MRVLLEQVRKAPVEWREDLELSPEQVEGSNLLDLSVVECGGRLSAVADGILIQGALRYQQTLSCGRCLEPVTLPVDESFDLLAVSPAEEPEIAEELELEQSDLDVVTVEGEELDTDPLVVEQVRLNVPMKPLCSEQCRGLCPRCGNNLNQGSCECPASDGDPRWSRLAALRDRSLDRG
ncbi:MAG TPA: DUF177 domain-containing protein [Thermoanaerobaculia bacterium]|nr:DUF177 domain-containing protein [Thermoanaerobaculia bacterium]